MELSIVCKIPSLTKTAANLPLKHYILTEF